MKPRVLKSFEDRPDNNSEGAGCFLVSYSTSEKVKRRVEVMAGRHEDIVVVEPTDEDVTLCYRDEKERTGIYSSLVEEMRRGR